MTANPDPIEASWRPEVKALRARNEQLRADNERLRAAIEDLVALIKGVDAEANNVQLDIARLLRRHHLDARTEVSP